MNKRDREILNSLRQFRVLDRDQLISIHFNELKQPVVTCNRIMKRLQLNGHVEVNKNVRPYDYFPSQSPIKKTSGKLSHFKAIADFVIEARKFGRVSEYEVEVKLGKKGTVEPDLFMLWNGTPFFVEVQNSYFNQKQMSKKLERYEDYYSSGLWKELHWQPANKKYFPYVLIVADRPYSLEDTPFRVFQVRSMTEFVDRYVPKKKGSH
ncbi:replication-relaxation family protein [Bacillus phage PK2]|nr:replication-relaxation family protein [Bacillus phage PK2]